MGDILMRGDFPDHHIRFAICHGAALCREGITRHRADPLSGRLLGEALVCATLLSMTLKDGEKITLRWMYEGEVGTILADMNERGEVRGFTQRKQLLPEVESLAEAMGKTGRISAVTSTPSRQVRTGITETVFQNVPRDLAYFLSLSFQIESALAVGMILPHENSGHGESLRLEAAQGVMIQPLPGCDLERFDEARQALESAQTQAWLEEAARPVEEIVARIGIGEPPRIYGELEPAYSCECSRTKADTILRMYDPAELHEVLEADGKVEVNCHFCADAYVFSADDLEIIFEQSQAGNG